MKQYPRVPEATAEAPTSDEGKLFDITCVIGSVYRDDNSGFTPREVAFLMIARHGADGVFHFPNEDGDDTVVEVISPITGRAPLRG